MSWFLDFVLSEYVNCTWIDYEKLGYPQLTHYITINTNKDITVIFIK